MLQGTAKSDVGHDTPNAVKFMNLRKDEGASLARRTRDYSAAADTVCFTKPGGVQTSTMMPPGQAQ